MRFLIEAPFYGARGRGADLPVFWEEARGGEAPIVEGVRRPTARTRLSRMASLSGWRPSSIIRVQDTVTQAVPCNNLGSFPLAIDGAFKFTLGLPGPGSFKLKLAPTHQKFCFTAA